MTAVRSPRTHFHTALTWTLLTVTSFPLGDSELGLDLGCPAAEGASRGDAQPCFSGDPPAAYWEGIWEVSTLGKNSSTVHRSQPSCQVLGHTNYILSLCEPSRWPQLCSEVGIPDGGPA